MKRLSALLACLLLLVTARPAADACTNVIITKGASADGSCMVTYAADSHQLYGELYFHPAANWPVGSKLDVYDWDSGYYRGKIAQVPHTFQTVGK